MSDTQKNSSFANAFIPGLILGLVIGAAAGAFLPDLLGGSNIPAPDTNAVPADRANEYRDGMDPTEQVPEIDPETGLPIETPAETPAETPIDVPAEAPAEVPPAP